MAVPAVRFLAQPRVSVLFGYCDLAESDLWQPIRTQGLLETPQGPRVRFERNDPTLWANTVGRKHSIEAHICTDVYEGPVDRQACEDDLADGRVE